MKNVLQVLIAIFIVSGCASTHVTGVRDHEFITHSYEIPAVNVRIDDLQHQLALEALFVQELMTSNIEAIEGSTIYPPTRVFTAEEWANAFLNSSADSVLIVTLKEGSMENHQVWLINVIGRDVGKVVWTGESKTELVQGNILDSKNLDTMFKSMAKSVVTKLLADGVLVVTGAEAEK